MSQKSSTKPWYRFCLQLSRSQLRSDARPLSVLLSGWRCLAGRSSIMFAHITTMLCQQASCHEDILFVDGMSWGRFVCGRFGPWTFCGLSSRGWRMDWLKMVWAWGDGILGRLTLLNCDSTSYLDWCHWPFCSGLFEVTLKINLYVKPNFETPRTTVEEKPIWQIASTEKLSLVKLRLLWMMVWYFKGGKVKEFRKQVWRVAEAEIWRSLSLQLLGGIVLYMDGSVKPGLSQGNPLQVTRMKGGSQPRFGDDLLLASEKRTHRRLPLPYWCNSTDDMGMVPYMAWDIFL